MMNDIEVISTPDAPAALGPYSLALRANGVIYCSGQIPLDPKTGQLVEGGIEAQTRRVLANLGPFSGWRVRTSTGSCRPRCISRT